MVRGHQLCLATGGPDFLHTTPAAVPLSSQDYTSVGERARPRTEGSVTWYTAACFVSRYPPARARPARARRVYGRHLDIDSTARQPRPPHSGALESALVALGPQSTSWYRCQPIMHPSLQCAVSSSNGAGPALRFPAAQQTAKSDCSLRVNPQRASDPGFVYILSAAVGFGR
jgi:hypothetical protein